MVVSADARSTLEPIVQEFRRLLSDHLNVRIATRGFLSCVSNQASKGLALRKVADMLLKTRDDIIAIGDGENDISMFDVAGISVAMSTAAQTVRIAATYVTGSVEADGVASFLEYLIQTRN